MRRLIVIVISQRLHWWVDGGGAPCFLTVWPLGRRPAAEERKEKLFQPRLCLVPARQIRAASSYWANSLRYKPILKGLAGFRGRTRREKKNVYDNICFIAFTSKVSDLLPCPLALEKSITNADLWWKWTDNFHWIVKKWCNADACKQNTRNSTLILCRTETCTVLVTPSVF